MTTLIEELKALSAEAKHRASLENEASDLARIKTARERRAKQMERVDSAIRTLPERARKAAALGADWCAVYSFTNEETEPSVGKVPAVTLIGGALLMFEHCEALGFKTSFNFVKGKDVITKANLGPYAIIVEW